MATYTKEELVLQAAIRLGFDSRKLTTSTERAMISCRHGHGKRTPCCSISITKNCFHCFSCSDSGSITQTFYQEFGHSISKELSADLSDVSYSNPLSPKFELPDYDKTPEIDFTFSGTLIPVQNNKDALAYVNRRGITLKVASDMGMKYAVRATSKLVSDPKDYIVFTGRLIVPIYETKLLSVEGRDIHGEKAFVEKMEKLGKKDAVYRKCLYPKGASTSTLFQLKKLDTTQPLYITEGLSDLAVLRSDSTFKNSTTVFGANITQRQLYLLSKFDVIYCCNDDLAGWTSVFKLHKYRNGNLKVLCPPNGAKDVGEIVTVLNTTVPEVVERKWTSRICSMTEEQIKQKIQAYSD